MAIYYEEEELYMGSRFRMEVVRPEMLGSSTTCPSQAVQSPDQTPVYVFLYDPSPYCFRDIRVLGDGPKINNPCTLYKGVSSLPLHQMAFCALPGACAYAALMLLCMGDAFARPFQVLIETLVGRTILMDVCATACSLFERTVMEPCGHSYPWAKSREDLHKL